MCVPAIAPNRHFASLPLSARGLDLDLLIESHQGAPCAPAPPGSGRSGLSLARIGELLKQQAAGPLPPTPRRAGTVEFWSHLVVADGVELNLEPSRTGLTPEQVRAFFRTVTQAYAQIHESEEEK